MGHTPTAPSAGKFWLSYRLKAQRLPHIALIARGWLADSCVLVRASHGWPFADSRLERAMNDAATMMRYDANKKSTSVAYLLWFFLGMFGAHRFYLGHTGTAVTLLVITLVSLPLMFVLIGLLTILIPCVWWLVDAFLIPSMTRDSNNGLVLHLSRTTPPATQTHRAAA